MSYCFGCFSSTTPSTLTLQAGDNSTVSIDDYYVALEPITKSNTNIDIVQTDVTNPDQPNKPSKYLQVFGKTAGTTIIALKDGEGTQATVTVNVSGAIGNIVQNGVTKARIKDFLYQDAQSSDGLGAVYFTTEGSVKEVGIQYKNASGQEVREILDTETDGVYLVGVDKLDCSNCYSSLQPYIIDTNGNTVYYNSVNIPSQYVSLFGSSNIASVEDEEESIKINSILEDSSKYIYEKYVKFVRNLKREFVKTVGNNTGYIDGTTKATLDAIEDLKNTPKDLIELITKTGKRIVKYYNGTADITNDISNGITELGVLATDLDTKLKILADYYVDLGKYEKDRIDSYVGVTMALTLYGPSGKLKTEKTVTRTIKEVEKVIKIGKANRISRVLELTKGLVGKYKNFECVGFRDEFRLKLVNAGIQYTPVYLRSRSDFIFSTDALSIFPDDAGKIATNGVHYATRIGDTIYDNLHPTGTSLVHFKSDLQIGSTYYEKFEGLD